MSSVLSDSRINARYHVLVIESLMCSTTRSRVIRRQIVYYYRAQPRMFFKIFKLQI